MMLSVPPLLQAIGEGLAIAIVANAGLDGVPLPEFLRGRRVVQVSYAACFQGKERLSCMH